MKEGNRKKRINLASILKEVKTDREGQQQRRKT
jgi:hypothetical protein